MARNGKTVLHLDSNPHYGGEEANFPLVDLEKLLQSQPPVANELVDSIDRIALRGERSALTPARVSVPLGDEGRAASRQYSLDLSPRLLLSGEQMIDLLVQSGVYRYIEFKSVEALLVRSQAGPLTIVPHSRADVFASRLSLKEKHALMQCLKTCSEPSTAAEGLFVDWLRSRGLSPELQRAVLYAVCQLSSPAAAAACSATEGLARMRAHLNSVGRFGSASPLLFPLYGTSELAQAFCRLAAVRGAVYVLKRAPSHLCLDAAGRCSGVVAEGQQLCAPTVVLPPDALPDRLLRRATAAVARGICVAAGSLPELPPRALAVIPSSSDTTDAVHVLQLDASMCVCPKDNYVVHFTSAGTNSSLDDVEAVMKQYCSSENGPKILWQAVFQQQCREPIAELPAGLEVSRHLAHAGPTFAAVLEQARAVFERLCPGAPFLPPLPDPDQAQTQETPAEPPATVNEPSASP